MLVLLEIINYLIYSFFAASNRWEFMSCEADISKSRPQSSSSSGKTLPRCFKKRIIQQNKYNGISSYSDWSKKMSIFQSEVSEKKIHELLFQEHRKAHDIIHETCHNQFKLDIFV